MESKKEFSVKKQSISEEDPALTALLKVDVEYMPLVTLLEQISPGENDIQFNKKMRTFETTMFFMCPTKTRQLQGFAALRAAALGNPMTARKLAVLGASFSRQQSKQFLRKLFIDVVMRETFSKLDVLKRSDPLFLINAANLMGDYFAEPRVCNGTKLHVLASPLLQYLRALLDSEDMRAHRSLARQLMQNGRELLSMLPQELNELSVSIRLELLTPPPASTNTWLLLSADLCLNKFQPLPDTQQQFFAIHLEETTEKEFGEVSSKKTPAKDVHRNVTSNIVEKVGQNLSEISLNITKHKSRQKVRADGRLTEQKQKFPVFIPFNTWLKIQNLKKTRDLNSERSIQ